MKAMTTRLDDVDDSQIPARQLDLEERARLSEAMEVLDAEFEREFGSGVNQPPLETGPEPWAGFLDLSLL